jgi:Nucleoside 2-deoxyribosyltransferase like
VKIVYSDDPLEFGRPSIFLAGPTPRRAEVPSWRPEALVLLRGLGFAGTVLVPERRDGWARFSYLDQVEWEYAGLEGCCVIAFWVPRDLQTLPGFTTNVEFGRYAGSGRCVYGRPESAPHTRYLDWLYAKLTGRGPEANLESTMRAAVEATRGGPAAPDPTRPSGRVSRSKPGQPG